MLQQNQKQIFHLKRDLYVESRQLLEFKKQETKSQQQSQSSETLSYKQQISKLLEKLQLKQIQKQPTGRFTIRKYFITPGWLSVLKQLQRYCQIIDLQKSEEKLEFYLSSEYIQQINALALNVVEEQISQFEIQYNLQQHIKIKSPNPYIWQKSAVLYPQKIHPYFESLTAPTPNRYLLYQNSISFPWKRVKKISEKHRIPFPNPPLDEKELIPIYRNWMNYLLAKSRIKGEVTKLMMLIPQSTVKIFCYFFNSREVCWQFENIIK